MLDIRLLNTVELEVGVAAQDVAKADAHQGKRSNTVVGVGVTVLQGGMVTRAYIRAP